MAYFYSVFYHSSVNTFNKHSGILFYIKCRRIGWCIVYVFIKKENFHKRRISADTLIKVNKFDFIEETSDMENKVLLTSENVQEENNNNNFNLNNNYGNLNFQSFKK